MTDLASTFRNFMDSQFYRDDKINSYHREALSNQNYIPKLPRRITPSSNHDNIAIAVSGGADSLALLILANKWAQDNDIKIIALTVNHNLRSEAAAEALYVSKLCAQINVKHHILEWRREKNTSSMHKSARDARYKLITNYCSLNNISTLLTAHHADDRIETFFIRLSKASGLIGLTSDEAHYYNNIRILRPLSNVYKKQLQKYLSDFKITPCEDPSNYDPKYQRSNIRKWIDLIPKELNPDLFKARILESCDHLKISADVVKQKLIQELAERSVIYPDGSASFYRHDMRNDDAQIELLLLSHLLTTVSGFDYQPRAESIELLLQKLSKESCKATLHGCCIEKQNNKIYIYRSFGKSLPSKIPLSKQIKWDGRWRANLDNDELIVSFLSMDNYIELKKDKKFVDLVKKVNKNILFSLPALFRLEKVVALPHMNYYNDSAAEKVTFTFEPSYTSRLIHFC